MMILTIRTVFFTQPTGGAAANNGNHDPRLLYIVVLGSSRAHHITPKRDARDDVIAVYVMRHLPFTIGKE